MFIYVYFSFFGVHYIFCEPEDRIVGGALTSDVAKDWPEVSWHDQFEVTIEAV